MLYPCLGCHEVFHRHLLSDDGQLCSACERQEHEHIAMEDEDSCNQCDCVTKEDRYGRGKNEAILAVTWKTEVTDAVSQWVETLAPCYRNLVQIFPTVINEKTCILLMPSGSKKGWDTDNIAEQLRTELVSIFSHFVYEDGSSPIDWIEVGWGEFGQTILQGNCINRYDDRPYAAE